ncbi:MAG: hypothetical protein AAF400_03125 [Bacteroidota bacterium]
MSDITIPSFQPFIRCYALKKALGTEAALSANLLVSPAPLCSAAQERLQIASQGIQC